MSNGERFGGNKNHFMTVASADNRNVEKVSKAYSIISKKSKSPVLNFKHRKKNAVQRATEGVADFDWQFFCFR